MRRHAVLVNFTLGMAGEDGQVVAYSGGARTASEGQPSASAREAINVLAVNGSLVPMRVPKFSSTFRTATGTGRGLHLSRAHDASGIFKVGSSGNVAISGFSDAALSSGFPSDFELQDGGLLRLNFGVGAHGDDAIGGGWKGISYITGFKPASAYNSGSSSMFLNGTTGTDRSLRYTVVRKVFDSSGLITLYEFESNPSDVFTTTGSKGTDPAFTVVGSASPYIWDLYPLTAVPNQVGYWFYRVYSSVPGLVTGDNAKFFFLVEYPIAVSTSAPTLPAASSINFNRPLGHAYFGWPANPLYPEDHAGLGAMQRVGDGLHGYSQASTFGGGSLLASVDTDLYASLPGYPMYIQTAYRRRADSFIEMIKPNQRTSVISSLNSLYTLTGTGPSDFSFDQIRGASPVKFDSGLAACWTPYGLLYPTDSSVVLFDGTNVNDVGLNRVARSVFKNLSRLSGVYVSDCYIVWDSTGFGYLFDFSRGPSSPPFVTQINFAEGVSSTAFKGGLVSSLFKGTVDTTGSPTFAEGKPTAFVSYLRGGTTYVRSFTPRHNEGTHDDHVTTGWVYRSNRIYLENPGDLVALHSFGLDWEGTSPTVVLQAFDYTGTSIWGKTYFTGTDMRLRRVPRGTQVDYVTVDIIAPADCRAVHRVHFYYESEPEVSPQ